LCDNKKNEGTERIDDVARRSKVYTRSLSAILRRESMISEGEESNEEVNGRSSMYKAMGATVNILYVEIPSLWKSAAR